MVNFLSYFISASLVITVLSCEDSKSNNQSSAPSASVTELTPRDLESLTPKDPNLASKYQRSCIICHANPDAMAPLVGDKEAWGKLIAEKGISTLVNNAKNGFNNMPPKGQCADCTDDDFKALIQFMSGNE